MRETWETQVQSLGREDTWRRAWYPLQYSCLDNPVDGGAWRATVHGVAQSQTWLKWLNMQAWALQTVFCLILTTVLWSRYYFYSHLLSGEAKTQKNKSDPSPAAGQWHTQEGSQASCSFIRIPTTLSWAPLPPLSPPSSLLPRDPLKSQGGHIFSERFLGAAVLSWLQRTELLEGWTGQVWLYLAQFPCQLWESQRLGQLLPAPWSTCPSASCHIASCWDPRALAEAFPPSTFCPPPWPHLRLLTHQEQTIWPCPREQFSNLYSTETQCHILLMWAGSKRSCPWVTGYFSGSWWWRIPTFPCLPSRPLHHHLRKHLGMQVTRWELSGTYNLDTLLFSMKNKLFTSFVLH